MKGYIPVTIPTKRYIKAYIISQLGEKPVFNRKTHIGSKMEDLLSHRTNKYKTRFSSRYNAELTFFIAKIVFHHRGFNLNETNIKNFNNFVEDLIKARFYELMDDAIKVFENFEANIDGVRLILGIDDEDWSTDSMRKDYYRYRKQSGKPLFYKKNFSAFVPSIPLHHYPFSFAK